MTKYGNACIYPFPNLAGLWPEMDINAISGNVPRYGNGVYFKLAIPNASAVTVSLWW